MARYPTFDRFSPVFHLGHVNKVYEDTTSTVKTNISTGPESQKIRFHDVMSTPANKSYKFAIPLLRGVSDSITRGDLILYTIIGNKNYYLGPINTNNTPYNSADHTYSEDITTKVTDRPDGYNQHIPRKTQPKLSKPKHPLMDFVGDSNMINIDSGDYDDSVFTDFILEGRYGNSIRLGARDQFPQIIISNNNSEFLEKINLGSSFIGMTSIGDIADNFLLNRDYRLSCEREEFLINVGNDMVNENAPEHTFNYRYGNKSLSLEEVPKSQIIISSDRIIFDSMDEDITISANRNINLGANKNFTLTNKGFSVFESKNIYIGRQAKNRTQPMVLGEELRSILTRILRLLADAQALGDMNVPQALTLAPTIHVAGTVRQEVENIMKEFNLGTLTPGENPPSPDPSYQRNVEDGIPVGDRVSSQATFLSQYHFVEENFRPDPTEETT